MTDDDDHNCEGYLVPQINSSKDGTSIVSGSVGAGAAFVLLECAECGNEFEAEYEWVEMQPID